MNDERENNATDDFAHLDGRAQAIDGAEHERAAEAEARELADGQAQAAGMVEDLVSVLKMARGMVGTAFVWWEHFAAVWNDDVLRGIAENGAILMQRHGWTMGQLMSKWGPYLGLFGAVAPAAYATWLAIEDRKKQQAAAKGVPGVGNQQAAD